MVCVEDLAQRCLFHDSRGKTRFASRKSHDISLSKSYAMSSNMRGDDSEICISGIQLGARGKSAMMSIDYTLSPIRAEWRKKSQRRASLPIFRQMTPA